MRLSAKSGASATSRRPPWPCANTCGTPSMAEDSVPSSRTTRSLPVLRSVTRMRPSGRKSMPQGWSRPEAISCTATAPASVITLCAWSSGS